MDKSPKERATLPLLWPRASDEMGFCPEPTLPLRGSRHYALSETPWDLRACRRPFTEGSDLVNLSQPTVCRTSRDHGDCGVAELAPPASGTVRSKVDSSVPPDGAQRVAVEALIIYRSAIPRKKKVT